MPWDDLETEIAEMFRKRADNMRSIEARSEGQVRYASGYKTNSTAIAARRFVRETQVFPTDLKRRRFELSRRRSRGPRRNK